MTKNLYKRYILAALVLLAAGAFLRTLNLNKEFSGDETILIEISRQDVDQIVPQLTAKDIYPPLTYLAVHYLMRLVRPEFWVRGYFVLFGIGVCWLVYLIAKEYLDERLGRVSLLLSVFSPLMIFTSQYARSYIDSAFWMLLSVLFMLKIIKGKSGIANWTGYAVSMALSLYTFYFSALLLFAQFVFVTASAFKDRKTLLKWYAAFSLVGLAFLPWAPTALRQFHNASSLVYDWAGKGLCVGPFRVGLYARNIFSLIGLDQSFMVFSGGAIRQFAKPVLMVAGLAGIGMFIFFLRYYFKRMEEALPGEKKLVWFLPCLILTPLAMTWVLAAVLNTLPIARYFVAFHALFLILMAVAIRDILTRKKALGISILAIMLIVFAARIPEAVSSEFGTRGASLFLRSHLSKSDCLICVSLCPEEGAFNIIKTDRYLKLNDRGSEYIIDSPDSRKQLANKIAMFKKAWFYKVYGNAEIFGANKIVESLLEEQGYRQEKVLKFKNIDIIMYKK